MNGTLIWHYELFEFTKIAIARIEGGGMGWQENRYSELCPISIFKFVNLSKWLDLYL